MRANEDKEDGLARLLLATPSQRNGHNITNQVGCMNHNLSKDEYQDEPYSTKMWG